MCLQRNLRVVQRLRGLYTLLANCLDYGGTEEVGTAVPCTSSRLWPERESALLTGTHTVPIRCPSRPAQDGDCCVKSCFGEHGIMLVLLKKIEITDRS